MTDRIQIFDTTLRDGEQAPGMHMRVAQKLRMAEALCRLGVDVIEAGFPAASAGDLEAVRAVARAARGPAVAGLARCTEGDIAAAWEAVREAERPRLHVFLATSPIHREHKLRMGRAEVLRRIRAGVSAAAERCGDVEFSAEDASRTEPEFLAEALGAAIEAGARTVNIPDTVGYATPEEFGALVAYVRDHAPGAREAVISVHCHDDLGMAVANSLAAVRAGARQVECTVNGVGERAGNASLEEVVMALRTRRDVYRADSGVDATHLCAASRLLTALTGAEVPANKAVVGRNAFAHESGIHQHGVLQHASTYEIMRPQDVGQERSALVLGKHSGRHAFRARLEELGHRPAEEDLQAAFEAFKELADRKSEIHDEDLEALLVGASTRAAGPWSLEHLQSSSGSGVRTVASVRLAHAEDGAREEAAVGDGPVDAVFRAMRRATGCAAELRDFRVRSVGSGPDAMGRVTLEIEAEGELSRAFGMSTDIVEASALAFLDFVNRRPARVAEEVA